MQVVLRLLLRLKLQVQPHLLTARGRRLVERIAEERNQTYEEAEARYFSFVSTRSWVAPEEVANMAVFLASDAAKSITGQAIGVCGNLEWEE